MSRRPRRLTFFILLLVALAVPIGWVAAHESDAPYVVVFNDDAVTVPFAAAAADASFLARASAFAVAGHRRVDPDRVASHVRDITTRDGVTVSDVYSAALGGFSARLTPRQTAAIASDPSVAAVIPDDPISLDDMAATSGGTVRTTANPENHVQPGIRRVGARVPTLAALTAGNLKIDADVAILDTGIQRNHPDLNVAGGYNCTGRDRTKWDDNDGHGTHVAGIVGALDNRFGVTGVAPGVRLWSVKVLDGQGRGFVSWLVCGIDWVTAQRDPATNRPMIEVANMSLAFGGGNDRACGTKNADTLHQAICRSVDKGIVYVVAAGNNSQDVAHFRPASYDEVITVSAMADYDGRGGGHGVPSDSCPFWSSEPDDAFTSFSNYGAGVDLIAPGKCILSTYLNGRYAWMSGTSMATPHVTGAALLYKVRFPDATAEQVRTALEAVGTLDWRTGSDPDKQHEKAVWIGQLRSAQDFSMTTTIASGVVTAGSSASVGVSLDRLGVAVGVGAGVGDPITTSLMNPPTGIAATPVITAGNVVSLTIRVAPNVRPGTYPLTVLAAGDGVSHSQIVSLVVSTAPPRVMPAAAI